MRSTSWSACTWTITIALSAGFAALAGMLLLGFSGSAYAADGAPYLFLSIAAVVIGGTVLVSIYGREPHVRQLI